MLVLVRRLGGVLLLAVLALLAGTAGVTGFLAAATITSRLPLLCLAGLVATAAVAAGVSRAATALLLRRRATAFATDAARSGGSVPRRRWLAPAVAAFVTVACAALFGATVLVPGPRPAPGAAPSWVRFWQLPTGSRIAYAHQAATGARRPYPVIFLHGGPGTPGNGLPPVAAALAAEGLDVYAYDQLGAGRSTRLTDVTGYTVARHVADLEAIRAGVGAEKLILIGQSWGGSLAAQYLAAHPARVDRVAFTSPGALWPAAWPGGGSGDPWTRMPPGRQRERDRLTDRPRVYAQALLQQVNPNAAHALVGDDEADELLHRMAVLGKDAGLCPGGTATVHDNHQGFYVNQLTVADFGRVTDPRPVLRRTSVPAMILRGSCDFVPWPVTREYRETFAGSALVAVPGAGHGIAADQPRAYAALLLAFTTGRALPAAAYTADADPAAR